MQIATPSSQGVDPAGIAAFVDDLDRDDRVEPHGLIIQRHGRRIAEGYWAPHDADRIRLVYSLSKSFTGTALGLQVGEGRLALDDLVSAHLPELFDGADERAARMRIRHIASMATGHDRETYLEALTIDPDDPVRAFFTIPPDAEPGSLFAYNQPPVLALATVLQRLAGERLTDYLRPRVLDPIGIGALRWSQFRPGVDLGFSGVHTNLDAIARLGQLHLDDGTWEGRRILPEGWVEQASAVQVANPERDEPDWSQGYGFQLWRSQHGYRGDGAFGQYMIVLPEHDAVIAIFSCVEVMQIVMNRIWKHLLPAMGPDPLPDSPADAALARQLAGLRQRTPAERHGAGPPVAATGTYAPATPGPRTQRSLSRIDVDRDRLVIHEDDARFHVTLSADWQDVDPIGAASAATLPDGRLAVDLAILHTPHRLEIELDPAAGTFAATWPLVPLATGRDSRLAEMIPPAE